MATNKPEAISMATRKVSALETLFARIFRIVAGKEYLISIHWSPGRRSYSRPLRPSLIKLVLGTAAVLLLGLACLSFEMGRWAVDEVRYHLALTYHHRYIADLDGVQTTFGSVETTLDTVFDQERKMQALYGINYPGSGYSTFGVGGGGAIPPPMIPPFPVVCTKRCSRLC